MHFVEVILLFIGTAPAKQPGASVQVENSTLSCCNWSKFLRKKAKNNCLFLVKADVATV